MKAKNIKVIFGVLILGSLSLSSWGLILCALPVSANIQVTKPASLTDTSLIQKMIKNELNVQLDKYNEGLNRSINEQSNVIAQQQHVLTLYQFIAVLIGAVLTTFSYFGYKNTRVFGLAEIRTKSRIKVLKELAHNYEVDIKRAIKGFDNIKELHDKMIGVIVSRYEGIKSAIKQTALPYFTIFANEKEIKNINRLEHKIIMLDMLGYEPEASKNYILGLIEFYRGEFQESRNMFLKAMKQESHNADYYLMCGICEYKLMNFASSEKYLKKAIELNSKIIVAYTIIATMPNASIEQLEKINVGENRSLFDDMHKIILYFRNSELETHPDNSNEVWNIINLEVKAEVALNEYKRLMGLDDDAIETGDHNEYNARVAKEKGIWIQSVIEILLTKNRWLALYQQIYSEFFASEDGKEFCLSNNISIGRLDRLN